MSIAPEDMEYLRAAFVTRDSCDNKMNIQEEKLDAMNISLQEIHTDSVTTKRLVWGILGTAVTIAVKLILG